MVGVGLVMLGTNNVQAIQDMLGYAQETQHEKILLSHEKILLSHEKKTPI